ncbi:MAG: hypothetical protein NVS9B6_12610 [Candidatus Limnocylindrales bacterium]
MFGIGTEELLLILVIALVVLGPERMPKLARDLGRMVGDFRRTSDELRNEFLNADRIIDVAAAGAPTPQVAAPVEAVTPVDAATASGTPEVTAAPASGIDVGMPLSAEALFGPEEPLRSIGTVPPEPLTEAAVTTVPTDEAGAVPVAGGPVRPVEAPDPDETSLDREAREARERLQDPARARQAAAEGWKTPTDEAGTTDRWG